MIRVEVEVPGVAGETPAIDVGAIAGVVTATARSMPAAYPDFEEWEVVALRGGSRYDLRDGLHRTKSAVLAVGPGANRIQVGQIVTVGYYDRDPARPFILTALGWASWGLDLVAAVGLWLCSHAGPGQNALGDQVGADRSLIDGASENWAIPTTNTEGQFENGCKPLGLLRVSHTGTGTDTPNLSHFCTAWPVRRYGEALWDLRIGAWDSSTRELMWYADFPLGETWPPPSLIPKSARLFYSQADRWVHALPDQGDNPRIFSARNSDAVTQLTKSLGKPCLNASLASFRDGANAKTYLALPYTDAGPDAWPQIEIWELTGDWARIRQQSVAALILESEILESGHAVGGAVPWHLGVLIFASGRTPAADPEKHQSLSWALASVGPDSSDILARHQAAAGAPTELGAAQFKDEALATPYVNGDRYNNVPGVGRWTYGTAALSTAEDFAWWKDTAQILLPAQTRNTIRMGTLGNHLDCSWPGAVNAGGGAIVSGGKVWFCTMAPEQVLYGGHYELREVGQQQTYKIIRTISSPPFFASTGTVYEFQPSTDAWTPGGEPGEGILDPGPPVVYWQTVAEDLGLRPADRGFWVQEQGFYRRTWLRSIDLENGQETATDISQLCDAEHGANLRQSGSTHVSTTVESVPIPDNVWQLLAFPDQDCLALLRDWRADGPGHDASPHLELRKLSDPSHVYSRTALGTQELFDESPVSTTETFSEGDSIDGDQVTFQLGQGNVDTITAVYRNGDPDDPLGYTQDLERIILDNPLTDPDTVTVEYSYIPTPPDGFDVGDRVWDQYFYPPRMKACAELSGDGGGHPAIQVAIWEDKRIDSGTQSGFKRAVHHRIVLDDVEAPDVQTYVNTSDDVGIGSSTDPGGTTPLWEDWDSLVMAGGAMTWIRDSNFREIVP